MDMDNAVAEGDRLYLIAESLAQDFSLFPEADVSAAHQMRGLLAESEIIRRTEVLANIDIDTYIESVIAGAEDARRIAAPEVIRQLGLEISEEISEGPFYSAFVRMDFDGEPRLIGFIAQDRSVRNGVWGPDHHLAAAARIEECSKRAIPIVSLMDTPGADAEAEANRNNQAHSISRLIAEMSNVDVPNLGIILGLGYSGGAIPLAASNMILSVRDGVFSTIQPQGLASIARRMNLSWQECAKFVGLSPFELYVQGNIDGVIDYEPGEEGEKLENLRLAIVSGIQSVEERAKAFVAENPYILDHYRSSLQRYLNPSDRLKATQTSASLNLPKTPTEYLNVFGVTYRYLRYLCCRRRIKATSTQQYGRLSEQDLPTGELAERADRERRRVFLRWLQDPDHVQYDDAVARAWKNYGEKKQAVNDVRGRIAQLIFGEPKKNYDEARVTLLSTIGGYLYNRWKTEAVGNFRALKMLVADHKETRSLLRVTELPDPEAFLGAIASDQVLGPVLRERFTHEGKKLLSHVDIEDKSRTYVCGQLAAELNLALTEGPLGDLVTVADLSADTQKELNETASSIIANRMILEDRFSQFIEPIKQTEVPFEYSDLTVLDIILEEELRGDFITECDNFLLFDAVYDQIIANLDSIAEEAERSRSLAKISLKKLIDTTFNLASKGITLGEMSASDETNEETLNRLQKQFYDWFLHISAMPKSGDYFRAVEEWKKSSFAHLSDTLFVVVTFLFEKLLVSYLHSEWEGRRYDGRISPRNIGRKKDFWHRLNVAYRDLLMQEALRRFKGRGATAPDAFIEKFFLDFRELFKDLLSSDPRGFPGFRLSIEAALQKEGTPCGVVTGIGTFNDKNGGLRVGTVISNASFQAGAFDMASAEKFCKLLVACAEQHLPVICFISSSGMQTKEGAGALFSMAAINDRITRFVRDHDLPVIVFGFGDCTGGAQASFVTHPLVQTYYFSGTSMGFAGQIVVPSNLPLDSILSNYLCDAPGAMQGLVCHPFFPDLDEELRGIDPQIPIPHETVADVVNRVMSGVLMQEREMLVPARPSVKDEDLVRPVSKVLIHARGCTAVKLIRVAQQFNIDIVLVQSDPDMESVPVDMLGPRDSVVCIGGNTPDESYLNARSVMAIAEHEEVDALHPGIGFLSESSQFAELVRSRGINFIGPPVASMDTMGNKSNAITTAISLDVPVVPGSHGIVTNVDRAAELAEGIGYPVLIKAVHGGGGKGIQIVESRSEFYELFQRVSTEAKNAFGNGDVYLEKYVTSLRHIEAQLVRDYHGNTKVLGIRDCSVQRDKQKVIEESGSTMLPEALESEVIEYSAAIADKVGYVGAGTVEFIYDLKSEAIYFMEMNTRLQVEHPVTEKVSCIDIVGTQFNIASGESISALEVDRDGYAIEARVNAERLVRGSNGALQFQPSPGTIVAAEFPDVEGIDVITSAAPNKFVSPYYDSMVGQIIAHGRDRDEAAQKLAEYLDSVTITGISTNIPLVKRVLRDPTFLGGEYDTGYLLSFLKRVDAEALISEIDEAAGVGVGDIGRDSIEIENSDELRVLAPATGIFYSTPSPAEPEYVHSGMLIRLEDTLCQLEAFKIFSPLRLGDFNAIAELYPDREYQVTRINITTGQQVNAGDLLFVVKPV